MQFKDFSVLSLGSQFVHHSRALWAILVEGFIRNICVELFQIWSSSLGGDAV